MDYKTLLYRTYRRTRKDGLTPDERVAINIFWRDGVKVPILSKVFHVAKNTIYTKCLTGDADSYPNTPETNLAAQANAEIERLGKEKAREIYVTPEMQIAIDIALADAAERNNRDSRAVKGPQRRHRQSVG